MTALNQKALEAAAKSYDDYTDDLSNVHYLMEHQHHHKEAIGLAIQAYLQFVAEQVDVEEVIVEHFKNIVREEFPNSKIVPNDYHHRRKAKQVITALRNAGVL